MLTGKRVLVGLAGILLLAGGLGASIAATEGGGEGRGRGGWHGQRGDKGEMGRMGHRHDGPRAQLTDEEIDARVRERFARIDRNSDGVIDRSEVEATMSQSQDDNRSAGRGRHLLQRFDENRDGKITKDEFLTGIKRRFAQMDLDGDGKITEADLPPVLRGSGILTPDGRSAMRGAGGRGDMGQDGIGRSGMGAMLGWLRDADANRDGVITLDEALAHAAKQFARLDRNGDGVADQADRDQMRKETADYRVLRFLHRFDAVKDGKVTREQFAKVSKERMARMEVGARMDGGPRMEDGMGGGDSGGRRGYRGGGHHRGGPDHGPRRGRGGPDGGSGSEAPAAQPQPGQQPGSTGPARP